LQRKLSAGQMTMVAVGGSISTGLLLGSAAAMEVAGPTVILTFVLAAFITWTVTLALGELASLHPSAGSFQLYGDLYLSDCIQRSPELFSERRLVERSGLPEASRQEQSNSPVLEDTEQVGVTNDELAEVHGDAPVHEVEEHEPARVILLDADRQLVREAADRLPRRRSERDVWVVLWTRSFG
jgi:Amino acid permease